MFTRPVDLGDDRVADALVDAWGIAVDEIAYAPVGFGSHHWAVAASGQRWFLNVDDLELRRRNDSETRGDAMHRLRAALDTAAALERLGHDFVVAPISTAGGAILQPIEDRFALSVYPHVDGTTYDFGRYDDAAERNAVVDRLVELHGSTDAIRHLALTDDFLVPGRDHLVAMLNDDVGPWGPGPFAAEARSLLARHAEVILSALRRHDRLVDAVSASAPFVITHGEPHRANTISTADGVVLIDWETALLAPAERDLWMLMSEDASVADRYTALTGHPVNADVITLYTQWWDLCEVSLYAADLQRLHADTADTRVMWRELQEYLEPARWERS